jgi:short-subunit dehydrogenase
MMDNGMNGISVENETYNGTSRRLQQRQVVVITGASSGIGRATALRFAQEGAAVALVARNQDALEIVAREVEARGAEAMVYVADVSDPAQMDTLAAEVAVRFGRIDTWVNNAAVALYAPVENSTYDEFNQIIQVNLMGVVNGSRAALPYMKSQRKGTIINISSVLGERAVALQAAYTASKHAVKGFTEALRLEQHRNKTGVEVVLVLPSSINTPFFNHARSKMGYKPQPIPPVYPPEMVADAIVYASKHPENRVYAGGMGKFLAMVEYLNPKLVDWFMLQNDFIYQQQLSEEVEDGLDNLYSPMYGQGRIEGDFGSMTKPTSLYTRLVSMNPIPLSRLLMAAPLLLGVVSLLTRRRRKLTRREMLEARLNETVKSAAHVAKDVSGEALHVMGKAANIAGHVAKDVGEDALDKVEKARKQVLRELSR